MKITASIPIKEQLLCLEVLQNFLPSLCFNSYKGTIVITIAVNCYNIDYSFNSYKGTIVIFSS